MLAAAAAATSTAAAASAATTVAAAATAVAAATTAVTAATAATTPTTAVISARPRGGRHGHTLAATCRRACTGSSSHYNFDDVIRVNISWPCGRRAALKRRVPRHPGPRATSELCNTSPFEFRFACAPRQCSKRAIMQRRQGDISTGANFKLYKDAHADERLVIIISSRTILSGAEVCNVMLCIILHTYAVRAGERACMRTLCFGYFCSFH